MSENDRDKKDKGKRIRLSWALLRWVYTIGSMVVVTGAVLVNLEGVFGEDGITIGFAGMEFLIYRGQTTALQLLGATTIAVGLLSQITESQYINRVSLSAMAGTLLIMAGLVIQLATENFLLVATYLLMVFYIIGIWLIFVGLEKLAWPALYWIWQKVKKLR